MILINLAPIIPFIFAVTLGIIYLVWGRGMHAAVDARERIIKVKEKDAITDVRLLKQSMFALTLVISGFVLAHPLRLEPATIAMFGAALLLLLSNFKSDAEEQSEEVNKTFAGVEWITIFSSSACLSRLRESRRLVYCEFSRTLSSTIPTEILP